MKEIPFFMSLSRVLSYGQEIFQNQIKNLPKIILNDFDIDFPQI